MPNYVTLEVYLVDEDGNFIVTEQGDRIVVDTFTVPDQLGITQNATAADSLLFEQGRSVSKRLRHAPKSWDVLPIGDEYVVRFNQFEIAGRWKSIWSALGQVAGTYTRYDGTGIPSLIQSPTSTNPAISLNVTPPTANLGDTVNFATTFFNFPTDISEAVDTLTLTYTDPLGGTGLVSANKDQIIDNLVPAFALNIPGTWTFRVDVISSGINFVGFSTDTVTISVPNTPPVINSFTVAPSVTGNDVEGQPSTIAFSATDAESSFLTYTLTGDQGTSFTGSVGNGIPEVLTGVMPAGIETYTLTVTDVNGLTDTETTTVTGQANTAPVINSVNRNRIPGGGSVINSGDTVQVAVSFNDLNGTDVNYVIRQDDVVKASGTASTGSKNFTENITNVTSTSGFEVTLTDTVDPSLTATATSGGLTLNTAPSVTATMIENTTSLTLNGTVTDDLSPDSDLTYTWEEFKDGVSNGAVPNFNGAVTIDDFGAPLAIRNTTGMAPGTYTYALTVTDGLGLSTTDTASNSYVRAAANVGPTLTDQDDHRSIIYNGVQIALIYDCVGADPDGDGSGTMTYLFEYSLDGGSTFTAVPINESTQEMFDAGGGSFASCSWTASANPIYNGTYTFRFTLTDAGGLSDSVVFSTSSMSGGTSNLTITDQTPTAAEWSPANVATSEQGFWVNADAIDQADGTPVNNLLDEYGNVTFTNGSGTGRPKLSTNVLNGRNSIEFTNGGDGDDFLDGTWTDQATIGSGDVWMYTVADHTGNFDNNPAIMCLNYGQSPTRRWMLQRASSNRLMRLFQVGGQFNSTTVTSDNVPYIIGAKRTSGLNSMYIDGTVQSATSNVSNDFNTTAVKFGSENATFGCWDGNIYEVVVGKGTLTDDLREKLEGYFAHKYALTAQLPANHPYKSTPPTV